MLYFQRLYQWPASIIQLSMAEHSVIFPITYYSLRILDYAPDLSSYVYHFISVWQTLPIYSTAINSVSLLNQGILTAADME